MKRLVSVEWWDAWMQGGWVDNEEAERMEEEPTCTSVGFVVGEDDKWLKLAQTDGSNQKGNLIKIPKKWIKSTKPLER